MSQPNDLKGIGGWLALLIVGLCFLHPIIGAYQGVQNFSAAESNHASFASLSAWTSYKQSAWGLFAIVSVLRVAAGVALLLSRQSSARRFTVAVLWLCPLISAVGDCLLLFHYFEQNFGDSAAASLFKSVRVRNTYGVRPNNSFKPNPLRGSA
jgi:hypothetical protein